jgi:cytochrome c oxidase subunit IV
MIKELKSAESIVWMVLMAITALSWLLGANHGAFISNAFAESSFLIVLAFIKIRLILFYFMEVRHGPITLRLSCEAWLIFSCIGILAFLGDFL